MRVLLALLALFPCLALGQDVVRHESGVAPVYSMNQRRAGYRLSGTLHGVPFTAFAEIFWDTRQVRIEFRRKAVGSAVCSNDLLHPCTKDKDCVRPGVEPAESKCNRDPTLFLLVVYGDVAELTDDVVVFRTPYGGAEITFARDGDTLTFTHANFHVDVTDTVLAYAVEAPARPSP